MTVELQDTKTFNATIEDGATEQLEVRTATAEYVQVLIDDGTTGNKPNRYTMTQDVYVPQFGDYQFYDEVSNETARSWQDVPRGSKMRFTFKNTSGADAQYRISVKSFE